MSKPNKNDKDDETKLIGIDFNNLEEDFCGTIKKVSQSQDIPIIEEISSSHNQIKSILTKRKNSLKSLEKSNSETGKRISRGSRGSKGSNGKSKNKNKNKGDNMLLWLMAVIKIL